MRSSVEAANSLTSDLQVSVEHWPWVGLQDDGSGQPKHADQATQLYALVEDEGGLIETDSGEVVKFRHHLIFPAPIEPYGTADRDEPIDIRDKFVLPGDVTGQTLKVKGPIDPTTGRSFMTEVWLG